MIAEMIISGFFAAIGWMMANWTVDKIMPPKPPIIEQKKESDEK